MAEDRFQRINVDEKGARLAITLSRTEHRNSLDGLAWDELDAVLRDVARRDEVRVVTLTGEGTSFCAGVDFEFIGNSLKIELTQYPSFIRHWANVADQFERIAATTIAAINGPAIGAGMEIALACDIRIASDRAVFCMPQMRMGIVPDAGGTSRLSRAAGEAMAKDLVLSCRVIDAEEALRCGIVSRVVEHDSLTTVVDELAEQIADLPWPSAYFATVAINAGPSLDPRRVADLEGIADQVMLREQAVWDRIDSFMESKGLKGYRGQDT